MTRSFRPRAIAALALLVAFAVVVVPAAAQTATPSPAIPVLPTVSGGAGSPAATQTATPFPALQSATFEMLGAVNAVNATSITVNGQLIDISTAEVSTALGIGTLVKVEGTLSPTGQLVARQVQAVDPAQAGLQVDEVELVGLLTAQTGNRLTIAGIPMDATVAEIKPGVAIGAWVKVHSRFDNTGTWIIREIELAADDDFSGRDNSRAGEFEITGTLTSLGANSIVVNSQIIDTTTAEIHGPLIAGALVKVHVSIVNGAWVAREVELTTRRSDDDSTSSSSREIEIFGTLTAVNGTTIVVDGRQIDISRAEIKDPLVIGTVVKVHLSVVNGVSIAREVELANDDDRSGSDDSGSSSGNGSDDSGGDDHGGNSGSDDSGGDDHSGNSSSDDSGSDDHGGNSGSDDSGSDDHSGNSGSDDSGSGDHGGDDD